MKRFFQRAAVSLVALGMIAGTAAPALQAQAASPGVVNPQQVYTYEVLTQDLQKLQAKYPDLIRYESIGKSPYGRDIWAVKLGKGHSHVFFNGSHHAREWMTTTLNMYMIDKYAQEYEKGSWYAGHDVRNVLGKSAIWFVPMVNPDGVTLQQKGVSAFPWDKQAGLVRLNGGSYDFTRWKANAEGVDLNRQYPAGWPYIWDNRAPGYMNHKGSSPLVTKEARALYDFTYRIRPEIAVSYHSSGRVIYWNYLTKKENLPRDQRLANLFASYTGYSLVPPHPSPSGGGYTDWFIQQFGKPAFTPELAPYAGERHVSLSLFQEEWRRNERIGLWIAEEGFDLWYPRNRAGIVVEGEKKNYDPQPAVINGRTVVPVRFLMEDLGATVEWDVQTKTATITKDETVIRLQLASRTAYVNDQAVELDTEALLIGGRLMVPIRFLAETLGAQIDWDQATRSVLMTFPPQEPVPAPDEETGGEGTPTDGQQPPATGEGTGTSTDGQQPQQPPTTGEGTGTPPEGQQPPATGDGAGTTTDGQQPPTTGAPTS